MFPQRNTILFLAVMLLLVSCQKDHDVLDAKEIAIENQNTLQKNNDTVDSVLVFSKTSGFRHASIEQGLATLREMGDANDFVVANTEESTAINLENLAKFKLVIFLNTTGDILNQEQQVAFENYIKAGGSFMGIHSATDTEYDWPWYGQLVGAYFNGHPNVQEANIEVVDATHSSAEHLNSTWLRTDEWYNFRNIDPDLNVLLNLDESSYVGGTNGVNHPIAWYREFDGGRSFYTGGGHTNESFNEPYFKMHLLGGIEYCLGR